MVAFASGSRRRSEIAGLRVEQLAVEPPIEVPDGPPLPLLAIHLRRTKTGSGEQDDIVYLTRRPVEALNAWMTAAKINKGSVFRGIGRWGRRRSGRSIRNRSMRSSSSGRRWLGWMLESFRRTGCGRDT